MGPVQFFHFSQLTSTLSQTRQKCLGFRYTLTSSPCFEPSLTSLLHSLVCFLQVDFSEPEPQTFPALEPLDSVEIHTA